MSKRPRGFAPWNPSADTLQLLADVDAVLEEYRAYLPLTVRQVFYLLIGGHGYEKSERFYGSLGDHLVRARRAGMIPFSSIRDDGIEREYADDDGYPSPADYLRTQTRLWNFYSRSWHDDQPRRVVLLAEAAGIVPILAGVARDYRIEVASSGGFDSLTAKHDLYSDALADHQEHDRDTLLLHVGDLDGSGVAMYRAMAEDLEAFCEDDGNDGIIALERAALTPEQRDDLGVLSDTRPMSHTNSHNKRFVAEGLGPPAQLEAVPPDDLAALVRETIEDALDLDALHASQRREREETAEVGRKLDEVNAKLPELFGLDASEANEQEEV